MPSLEVFYVLTSGLDEVEVRCINTQLSEDGKLGMLFTYVSNCETGSVGRPGE